MFVLITETVTTVRKLLYSARQPDTLYLLPHSKAATRMACVTDKVVTWDNRDVCFNTWQHLWDAGCLWRLQQQQLIHTMEYIT